MRYNRSNNSSSLVYNKRPNLKGKSPREYIVLSREKKEKDKLADLKCNLCRNSINNGLVYTCRNKHSNHITCIKENMKKSNIAICPQCKEHIRDFEKLIEKIKLRAIIHKEFDPLLIIKLLHKIKNLIKNIPEKGYVISALMEILYYIY